jgi:hypothetical protein
MTIDGGFKTAGSAAGALSVICFSVAGGTAGAAFKNCANRLAGGGTVGFAAAADGRDETEISGQRAGI